MTMTKFSKLKPFKGKVTKVEEIPFKNPPRSVSGPDFRVTVTKQDGSTIIITRIETYTGTAITLQKLVEKSECDLPDEIVQCEDKHGQETNCRINNLLLQAAKANSEIALWFLPNENHKVVERELLQSVAPPWNR